MKKLIIFFNIFTIILSNLFNHDKISKISELKNKTFNYDKTPISFKNFLMNNPFPNLLKKNLKNERRMNLKSKNNKKFILEKEKNNLDENRKMLTMKVNKKIERKMSSMEKKKFFFDKDLDEEEDDLTENTKSANYLKIGNPTTCPTEFKRSFLEIDPEYKGTNPINSPSIIIKQSCKELNQSCCSKKEFNTLLNSSSNILLKIYEDNFKSLSKVVKIMNFVTAKQLSLLINDNATSFNKCSNTLMKEDFIIKFQSIKTNISSFQSIYSSYMTKKIDEVQNLYCGICNFKNADFFAVDPKEQKYYINIRSPEAIIEYYNSLRDFQFFIPLISFANIIDCMNTNDNNKKKRNKDMDYEIINPMIIRQIQKIKMDNIIDQPELIKYFEDNYVPGEFLYPIFTDVLFKLKSLIINDIYGFFDGLERMNLDQPFGNIFQPLKRFRLSKNPEFMAEKIFLRYSNQSGYFSKENEFQNNVYLEKVQRITIKYSSISLIKILYLITLFIYF